METLKPDTKPLFPVHPDFKWNGKTLRVPELLALAQDYRLSGEEYLRSVGHFFADWLNDSPTMEVQTSGSTGAPKKIWVKKQYMVNSALATQDFFDLPAQTKALLCLPATYIAGKLMLVRALVLGWETDSVKPQSNPLKASSKTYDFCAMTPYQLTHAFDELSRVKKIMVGGGVISDELYHRIQQVPAVIYETYAMTETLTHIAARKINALAGHLQKPPFKILKGVTISTDARDCLVIQAPKVTDETIVTNDIVELINEKEFYLKGRYDNIINSGGIKIIPETVESKLSGLLFGRFFVTGIPDEVLGEKTALIIEGSLPPAAVEKLQIQIENLTDLNRYEKPKVIYTLPDFTETHSGKIKRKAITDRLIHKKGR